MHGFVQVLSVYWQELEIEGVTGNHEKSFCIIASPPAPPPCYASLIIEVPWKFLLAFTGDRRLLLLLMTQ